ncbi:MAG: 5'/3'-nucleotidase SurE, partial [Treponema sp.]|nr:5'/3'-nucleotidase SurE [Treponema sp.]
MNILVTNDDGYDSSGLQTLVDVLSKEHKVYVLAPDRNRSAVSNHITMFNDTAITKIKDKVYSCQGYPADCAAIGLTSNLFDIKFDLLISGINLGGNLGTDIVYSGTCAAARQAVFDKVPAIALSIQPLSYNQGEIDYKFNTLAEFVLKNLEELKKLSS